MLTGPFQGSIFTHPLFGRKSGIGATFTEPVRITLESSSDLAGTLLETYSIQPDTPDDEALVRILKYANDVGFQALVPTLAQAFPDSAIRVPLQRPQSMA